MELTKQLHKYTEGQIIREYVYYQLQVVKMCPETAQGPVFNSNIGNDT